MENIKDEFRKEFCECCGSQRCSGQDDELVHCERFKNLMDNSGKPSVKNHKMGPKSKLPSKYYEDRMEETQSKREYDELRMPLDDDDKLATEATIMGKRILPPDGYLVGKITQTDNGMLVEYVEKKPKYPATFEECLNMLYCKSILRHIIGHKAELLLNLEKLLICRDAYWKIAGEEMGLDKPWKPDWDNLSTNHEFIKINKGCFTYSSRVLVFPTTEMRDAFYKNFKDLIESCKELL